MRQDNKAAQPENTKERIREAAIREFSAQGFAGARVDRIAKAAGVNIRMIYYFFGSKDALLKDVVSDIFRHRQAAIPTRYDTPEEVLIRYFESFSDEPEAVRLLVWEALQTPSDAASELSNFEDRRGAIKQRVDGIKSLQKKGLINPDLDPKLLYLAFVALSIYTTTFPQTVFTATGKYPSNKAFKKQYSDFLRQIAKLLGTGGKVSGR